MSSIVPNPALLPPGAVSGIGGASAPAAAKQPVAGQSFGEVLADRTSAAAVPRFSKHALDRLTQRGIDVSGPTLGRLADGIQRAAAKGARNSVVLVDGTAFVASVPNNTVITAVTQDQMRSHVFTNIDSAVIA